MTRDEQRALLMQFAQWCADHGYLDSSFGGVDAFLASLPAPLPSCPVCGVVCDGWECRHGAKDSDAPCGACGHARYLHETQPSCVGAPGDTKVCGCQEWRPGAQGETPYRYWRVVRLVPGECWQMERVDADGKPRMRGQCHYERDYPYPMLARDRAEADGWDSGLPEWPGTGGGR